MHIISSCIYISFSQHSLLGCYTILAPVLGVRDTSRVDNDSTLCWCVAGSYKVKLQVYMTSFVRYFDKENLSITLESVEKEEVSGALGRHILGETRKSSGT